MQASYPRWQTAVWTSLLLATTPFHAGQPFLLEVNRHAPGVELAWPTTLTLDTGATVYPEYELQVSDDLVHWAPAGGKVRGIPSLSGERLKVPFPTAAPKSFYRILANPFPAEAGVTAEGGAQVFGYDATFKSVLNGIGRIAVSDFAAAFPSPTNYLSQISWDPTNAQFWTNFNYDPTAYNNSLPTNQQDLRFYDFRLNPEELAVFKRYGFVVSERMAVPSFAEAYYRVFNNDLPVFITTDSILQAWHRTYVAMLEEMEELQLSFLLEQIVNAMAGALPTTWQQFNQGPLRDGLLDADFFLTVARSLLGGTQVASQLNQDARVTNVLSAINGLTLREYDLFGTNRWVDFSQFQVRGHYDSSERLRRYFRAMMWCGRIDFRIGLNPAKDSSRELSTAVALHSLLKQSGQFNSWEQLELIIRTFVGITDSMTFAQLGDLLASANIQSLADIADVNALKQLHLRLLTGELGFQQIRGDFYFSPLSEEQLKLPRSFTVAGQKFVLDSWALSQVVFDSILWEPDDGVNVIFGKVTRRKPSCLDVAFSVLANDQVVPDLVASIGNTNGIRWRDGLPYQHNLAAARLVIDNQNPSVWTNNIYTCWLWALRALSEPTVDSKYPECMRTKAWGMKTLNTQLASWTELRHDTVLYAKQSYTAAALCSYPYGFVEPRPEFWRRMEVLASLTANAVAKLPAPQEPPLFGFVSYKLRGIDECCSPTLQVSLQALRSTQINLLVTFAQRMATLRGIAEKELAQQPLATNEVDFLRDVMESHLNSYYHLRQFSGWYPKLFYRNVFDGQGDLAGQGSDKWDALVTDVHTDTFDLLTGDPGAVIHEGVGNVHMMLIAVDNGPDRMIYAGPVLSHYEFEMPLNVRKTDEEWKAQLSAGNAPPHPEWTHDWLVPLRNAVTP